MCLTFTIQGLWVRISRQQKKDNHKEQILWFLWRTSLRCRFCKALCGAMMRLLDLALNQKVTTFGAWLLKKKNAKTTSEHLSVLSFSLFLSLSLSLSEGQFTFILPLFKLLTVDSFSFLFVGFMNLHCWQEKKVPRLTTRCISFPVQTWVTCWWCPALSGVVFTTLGRVWWKCVKTGWRLCRLMWQTTLVLYSKKG